MQKITRLCQASSPNIQILNVVIQILSFEEKITETFLSFLKEFIIIYVDCIPHSVYDETFIVFDLLLKHLYPYLDEKILQKCINMLLDQFTVKGKASRQSQQNLIEVILNAKDNNNLFLNAINICLIKNQQPIRTTIAVSYTHLTLPTKRIVQISVMVAS
eukprot:TRINITY_DN16349_c0_g1_i1.p3 TRINITY_DN16349_c0_g1~~TRINITY_DN16349_c0_g1_i1.p3  ORF type:complete len:160 (+),score=30.21 TRINITY_DN16349_c0_g1_i1:947-1426(+)